MNKWMIASVCTLIASASMADVVGDARVLIDEGKYAEASELLAAELAENPGSPNAGNMNALLGESLLKQGDLASAIEPLEQARKRGVADASRWLGKIALHHYDFTKAATLYDAYVKQKNAAKKEVAPEALLEKAGIAKGKEALSRVERIAIIDSISVPKDEFFKAYRLAPSAGRVFSAEDLSAYNLPDGEGTAFINERGDNIFWSLPDSVGNQTIVESIRLTDGRWHEPEYTSDVLNGGGDAMYPFMLSDGQTLYFANNGDDSMGGYDIFVATRDATDGSFLKPQNIGMPYNSPFDDYLLAIDEQTGAGWWATDRKLLPGELTVFVFVPNDVRENIDAEEEAPIPYARIDNMAATQTGDTEEYVEILKTIAAINPDEVRKSIDFMLPLANGEMLTSFDELPDGITVQMMKKYLETEAFFNKSAQKLDALRKEYHSRSNVSNGDTLAQQILDLEDSLSKQREALKKLRNDVYSRLDR